MYSTRSGLILAFHGCDQSIVDKIIKGKDNLKKSENSYDWLGHGAYFWENSPSRALDFVTHLKDLPSNTKSKNSIKNPAVIGAVLDLGYCLDLLDFDNLKLLKSGYELLKETHNSSKLPQNKKTGDLKELLLRELDCAVIQTLHTVREKNKLQPFDTVKGVFWEGDELYPNAGFREKDHIQICVRNPNCIKGFFLPRQLDNNFSKV